MLLLTTFGLADLWIVFQATAIRNLTTEFQAKDIKRTNNEILGLYEAETLSNGQEAVVFFFWSKINIIKFIK